MEMNKNIANEFNDGLAHLIMSQDISSDYKVRLGNESFDKLIYSPVDSINNALEYVLAYDNEKLVYLERQHSDRIEKYVINYSHIIMIRKSEELLLGKYEFYYRLDNMIGKLNVKFNNASHELYDAIVDNILDYQGEEDYKLNTLKFNDLVLYNYAHNANKLGDIKTIDYKYIYNSDGNMLRVVLLDSADGKVLITKENDKIDTWYIRDDSISLDIANKGLSLKIYEYSLIDINHLRH